VRGVLALLLLLAGPAAGGPPREPDRLRELVERARALDLPAAPRWQALLHYERRHFTPLRRSVVETPAFFLSPVGARNPGAELEATLAGLLDPAARSGRGEPVRCSFPARAAFLTEALGFEPAKVACPALEAWRKTLRPVALTLVFPEAFMGSPASMFGHTLLRLDVSRDEESENLLGYAIDFTADTGGEAGPVYLLKGVLGGYPARFGLNPFWEKLKQYADWQNRDLWEYRLGLDADEIDLVLLHLWELREVEIPYYFFDENCSYQLVRLLQTVRPAIEIRHGFPLSVIPIDTVRDVIDETGVNRAPRFRASPATKIRFALHHLPAEETEAMLGLADGTLEPDDPWVAALPPARRARVLGLAYDALRYRFLDDAVARSEARRRAHRLLLARSRLGLPDEKLEPPPPVVRPESGHGTAMLALAGGSEDGEPFFDLRLRPGLHDRLDPAGGHSPDSTIRVLDGTLRWYPERGRVRLEELVALELRSEAPRDAFFRPLSWHLSTGLRTRLLPKDDGDLGRRSVWRSEGGLGLSFAHDDWLRASLFAELRGEASGALAGHGAFGPGLGASLDLGRPDMRARLELGARAFRFLAGDRATVIELRAEPTVRLGRNLALVAGLGWNRDEGDGWLSGRLALRFYY